MTGGSRIVAFGPGGEQPDPAGHHHEQAAQAGAPPPDADWEAEADDTPAEPSRGWDLIWPILAMAAALVWSAFFLWANSGLLASGITPSQGAALTGSWAGPILLIAVCWLIAMRSSTRESARFADAASQLSVEASRLEDRLTAVNRELSLAREFIAAQSRDLESLGRVAAERLSQNAENLQNLIRDNGAQVEAIAGVSTAALDNMERLRGQLPVVASSARDVASNIGNAGRVADDALESLQAGLVRLAEHAEATNACAVALSGDIGRSVGELEDRVEQIQALANARLEELEHRGSELRGRLDQEEAASLAALQAHFDTLRSDVAEVSQALRTQEQARFEGLGAARARMEEDLRETLERIDQLDRNALEAARNRIAKLSDEAAQFDERLAERNRMFATETDHRVSEAANLHEREAGRVAELLAKLDADLAERMAARRAEQEQLAAHGEAIGSRLEALSDRIAAISAFGNQADETLGRSLGILAERLTASREALAGTDASVERLTDGAVRLLELLQASAAQSGEHLPQALTGGETRLAAWEQRVTAMVDAVNGADQTGSRLAGTVAETQSALAGAHAELERMQQGLDEKTQDQAASIEALRGMLAAADAESAALAERARGELANAVQVLTEAAGAAANALSTQASGTIETVAGRLGQETGAAIDRVMRARLAEAVGQLDQAASHASGVSREAAIQLRDQLARVDELAGNLERRVAQARSRAEEQVDGDFARRVALITESLNSSAIDIAKALSTEVTDTAWAAYLRGDRGVFTRRAVRLLDQTEAREIARIYEGESEFRDHVSRFIHDFEAMLRQLLSTRDGHALGVTLLSSDMGKLYVALAQGIERLRT